MEPYEKGKLTRMVYAARNKVRQENGLPPILPPPAEVLPPSTPETEIIEGEILTAAEPEVTGEVRDWQRVMSCLVPLEDVHHWAVDWEPGIFRGLLKLEHECVTAATNGHTQEYTRLKKAYLQILGQICQQYWKAHYLDPSVDFTCFAVGGIPARIVNDPTAPTPDDVLVIHTTELPQLLCTPLAELKKILDAKTVFPGARLL